MGSLQGRVALVTGASRGIGRAIALELGSRGCTVVVNTKHHAADAAATCAALTDIGAVASVYQADVASVEEVASMVDHVVSRYGAIDVLVNNAGIVRDRSLLKMTDEGWREVLDVNLTGVFTCTRQVVPHMRERGFGRVLSIASIVGQTGAFGQTNYAASKAGIIGFTKAAALEVARYGITVNAVCPGYVLTEMLAGIPPHVLEEIRGRVPLGRLGGVDDIARAVRFLVEEADYVTGQTLNVNGGLFMQ